MGYVQMIATFTPIVQATTKMEEQSMKRHEPEEKDMRRKTKSLLSSNQAACQGALRPI